MPIRIQLSRKKGWRLPPNTVVLARPTQWGNEYRVGSQMVPDHATAVALYRRMIEAWHLAPEELALLRGKNLACWCPLNQPCHADVLLELANAEPARAGLCPQGAAGLKMDDAPGREIFED